MCSNREYRRLIADAKTTTIFSAYDTVEWYYHIFQIGFAGAVTSKRRNAEYWSMTVLQAFFRTSQADIFPSHYRKYSRT